MRQIISWDILYYHVLRRLFLGFCWKLEQRMMKVASIYLPTSIAVRGSFPLESSLFLGHPKSVPLNSVCFRSRECQSRCTVLCFSRRRRNDTSAPSSSKKNSKKILTDKDVIEDDDVDEDALEALFSQLEEDLKNDELAGSDDEIDEIDEEELAKLEQELAEALEDDELFGEFENSSGQESKNGDEGVELYNLDDDAGHDEADDEEKDHPIKLKNWQLRRLAYALRKGRRKTSIKSLAADLCLDRVVVLKLLREPPPNLLMLSAALPDNPVSTSMALEEKAMETLPLKEMAQTEMPKVEVETPVHEMQWKWSAQKRLKKVQVKTLEEVYNRTKRPTNTMISSIVHVTNLPRKRVVQWFEGKRAEDGVPDNRRPYQRPVPNIFTS